MAAPTSVIWPGIHIPSCADVALTFQSKAMAVAWAKHFKFEFMLISLSSCFLFYADWLDDYRDGRRAPAPARLPTP
ncbi:hypothetical protein [Mesorhizobium huakuii]|uniref:Uncharacterized protein n=1 Tax=Mesorhizobium huakuii TaxID=28104 RepID=A0A7G6T4W3_9HYPH|nr:hypothetical protein [Mesorhizobium huakuii]QND61795.1 hypothetical protein HB778_36900 [Mesorhizobium huakuii]QND69242.1 hypothetical protein HB777_36430 [Mesorhizobium loti]